MPGVRRLLQARKGKKGGKWERWNLRINVEGQILSFLGLKAQFQEWKVVERISVKTTVVLAEGCKL